MSRRNRVVATLADVAQQLGSSLLGSERISRRKYWALGGPQCTRLWRRMRGGAWQHYYRHA